MHVVMPYYRYQTHYLGILPSVDNVNYLLLKNYRYGSNFIAHNFFAALLVAMQSILSLFL